MVPLIRVHSGTPAPPQVPEHRSLGHLGTEIRACLLVRLLSPAEAKQPFSRPGYLFPGRAGSESGSCALKTNREGRDRSLEELGRHLHPPIKVLINGYAKIFKQDRR